ncbi:MAG: stage II sporulation protein M [Candidatus Methanomethylicia archaeon]
MHFREITLMLIVSTLIFIMFIFIGYEAESFLDVFESLGETFKSLARLNPYLLALIIFLNNAIKMFITIVLGVTIGIFPVIFISLNGLMLGYAIRIALPELGVLGVASLILPHGVLEIPAALLSTALGLLVGLETIKKIIHKEASIKETLKHSLKIYVKYVVPMLAIAAVVEGFITPYISRLVIPGR